MSLLKPAKNKKRARSPEEWSTTHGLSKSGAYKTWASIIQRCTNKNSTMYKYYGGRGISVNDGWLKFENFYRDMGQRPDGMSLDRIDPNGNYEPSNCRWATASEQQRNRRDTRKATLCGQTKSIKEWAELCGVDTKTIIMRIKRNWPEDMIISTKGDKSNSVTRSNVIKNRNKLGRFGRIYDNA